MLPYLVVSLISTRVSAHCQAILLLAASPCINGVTIGHPMFILKLSGTKSGFTLVKWQESYKWSVPWIHRARNVWEMLWKESQAPRFQRRQQIFFHNYDIDPWGWLEASVNQLTHWGRDKMAVIWQTMLSNAFSWMKMLEFQLKFHWSLFLHVQLTIFQHWFR